MGSMTRIFGKKQVLLATLIVALGVAVYLNYYFSSQQPPTTNVNGQPTSSTSSTHNMGDAQFVGNSSVVSSPESIADTNDYFVQARLNRESAREEALDIVKDMMNDVKATDEVKKQAAEKAAAIAQAVEQESKIESLIKSKGFEDCVVYIEGENCSVVVRSEGLKPQESVQITEIVTTQSNIVAQNINIGTVK